MLKVCLSIKFILFSSLLTAHRRFRRLLFFCVEKTFLVFWVFVLFHSFFAFPRKRFRVDFCFFCVEKRFCQCWVFVCLFVFRLGYFIYFLCFEPPKAISSGLFCARESILVYFWCLGCFILFSSLFPSKSDFVWTSPSFVLEEAFWLMLGTVFALFHRISRVGVPSGLELGWLELSEPGIGVGVQSQP